MAFNSQQFIFEIKKRPGLWDMSAEDYTNRNLKKKLWREVVNLFGGAELTTEKEKKELGMALQRKWKNLRDSFARELRRLRKPKNIAGDSTRKHPYIYYKQMLFLKRTISNAKTVSNTEEATNTVHPENSNPYSGFSSANKKKKTDNARGNKELIIPPCKSIQTREELEKHVETDEDRMFLLSLLPELKKIAEPLQFPTKMEIMNVIQKAKMGANYSSEVPTYCQMTPVHQNIVANPSYENLTEQQFQTCVVSEFKVSPTVAEVSVHGEQNFGAAAEPKNEILDMF